MRTLIALAVCLAVTATATAQQTPASLSPHAQKVKAEVARLSPGEKLSVIPIAGPEEYGTLLSAGDDGFSFHDVDSNANVQLRFDDAKLVRSGYGGYNSIRGRHTDRHKGLIIGAICAAALIGLIVIATQRN